MAPCLALPISALSKGAQQASIWLNTGEGGLSPFHQEGSCDLVFQIGTAKYGVRNAAGGLDTEKIAELAKLPHLKMFEIKLSQGAKPGKGGILPGRQGHRTDCQHPGHPGPSGLHQPQSTPRGY